MLSQLYHPSTVITSMPFQCCCHNVEITLQCYHHNTICCNNSINVTMLCCTHNAIITRLSFQWFCWNVTRNIIPHIQWCQWPYHHQKPVLHPAISRMSSQCWCHISMILSQGYHPKADIAMLLCQGCFAAVCGIQWSFLSLLHVIAKVHCKRKTLVTSRYTRV